LNAFAPDRDLVAGKSLAPVAIGSSERFGDNLHRHLLD
jgi:hypothetical protein